MPETFTNTWNNTTSSGDPPAPAQSGTVEIHRTIEGYQERRALYQNFAQRIGRPVFVNNPHETASGMPAENSLRSRSMRGYPFAITFMTVPDSRTLRVGPCASGVGQDPDSANEYMFDGSGIVSARGLDRSLDTWAERAETQFVREIPLHWVQSYWGTSVRYDQRPTQGYDVAYLFKDHLFIPFDLVHFPGDEPITSQILEEAATALLEESPQTHAQRQEQRARIGEQVSLVRREAVLSRIDTRGREWLSNMSQHTRRRVEREYDEIRNELEQHRARYLNTLHRGRELEATLAGLDEGNDTYSEEDVQELRRMVENGVIQDIEFVNGGRGANVVVYTRNLLAFDDRTGAYHDIGRMKMTINMVDGAIAFRNQDRQIRGHHAPHVFGDGRPCMGNFAEMVADMVAEGNWLGLIQGAILFIETANTQDSAGQYVHTWPFCEHPEEYGYPAYPNPVEPLPPDASPVMMRAVARGECTVGEWLQQYNPEDMPGVDDEEDEDEEEEE